MNDNPCEFCGEGGEIRICGCGLRCCEGCWSKLHDCCPECAEDVARDDHYEMKHMEMEGK